MKFKDIINLLDPLSRVVLWIDSQDDDEEPAFDGYIMDIPWIYLDYEINAEMDYKIRVSRSKDREEPFFVINLYEVI